MMFQKVLKNNEASNVNEKFIEIKIYIFFNNVIGKYNTTNRTQNINK